MEEIIAEVCKMFVGINLIDASIPWGQEKLVQLLIKNGYLKVNSVGVIEYSIYKDSFLTSDEIFVGVNTGKLEAVKLHKSRTNKFLADCKRDVENEFERLGLKFKGL